MHQSPMDAVAADALRSQTNSIQALSWNQPSCFALVAASLSPMILFLILIISAIGYTGRLNTEPSEAVPLDKAQSCGSLRSSKSAAVPSDSVTQSVFAHGQRVSAVSGTVAESTDPESMAESTELRSSMGLLKYWVMQ